MSDELEKLERKNRNTKWIRRVFIVAMSIGWPQVLFAHVLVPIVAVGFVCSAMLLSFWEIDRDKWLKEAIRDARLRKFRNEPKETGTDG